MIKIKRGITVNKKALSLAICIAMARVRNDAEQPEELFMNTLEKTMAICIPVGENHFDRDSPAYVISQ